MTGVARRKPGCTPGIRDESNEGLTLSDFLERANAFIAGRREQGYGRGFGSAGWLVEEEVIAVRLYTGPCFAPINQFMRQIGTLHGRYREAFVSHPLLSFATATRHLASAIRKLASVATEEEASAPLWRGVRGELPASFWVADKQGMVVAVDLGFPSTSRDRRTPIAFAP